MPNAGYGRALAVDGQGHIWVGGNDEIARLEPDARGVIGTVSVVDRLPEDERGFGAALYAASAPDGVYFATLERIFFFSLDGRTQVWAPPERVYGLTWLGGALHFATTDGALVAVAGANFMPVIAPVEAQPVTSPLRRRLQIFAARSGAGGGSTLLTSRGPLQWAGPGSPLLPIGTEAEDFFRGTIAQAAVFLGDGRMAFGTVLHGVAVFDRAGNLQQRIDRRHGLLGNRIEQLWEDTEGGLWIAQRTGLARVQLDSPFASHGLEQGVDGSPRTLHRHEGRLYLAHNEGGAWRNDATGEFRSLEGLVLGLNRFLAVGSRLLATSSALYEIVGENALPAQVRRALGPLAPVHGLGGAANGTRPWLVGGSSANVVLLSPDPGGWQLAGNLVNLPAGAASLLPMPDGFVWAASNDGRVWRADFRAGPSLDAPVARYGPEQGVPQVRRRDEVGLFRLGDDVLATSAAWLLRYDGEADRFVPETRIAGLPASGGAMMVHRDSSGTLWLQFGPPARQLVQIAPDGLGRWRALPVPSTAVAGFVTNSIYHDEAARSLWVAAQGALVSIDLDWRPTRAPVPPAAVVRRVSTSKGEVLRVRRVPGDGLDEAAAADVAEFTAAQASLRFEFAAPSYRTYLRHKSQVLYRTRLAGLADQWTDWSEETAREFTQLPYRAFRFEVQARDADGREGAVDALGFAIAPPWWLTGWAIGGYAVAAGAGIFGVFQLRTRTLRRRAAQLEATVDERTRELAAQNTELDRLRQLELDEKTIAQLAEQKTRLEMLRYQLNPHFLFNSLNAIGAQTVRRPEVAREMMFSLGEFCRLALHRGEDGADATVAAEIEMLKSYLAIEQARRGDTMRATFEMALNAAGCALPPFLLLPLVENAIKYGSRTSDERLEIWIRARVDESALVLEVANSGRWVDEAEAVPGYGGIGLKNLRERLRRHYPGAHEFSTGAEESGVVARVVLRAAPRNLAGPDSSPKAGSPSQLAAS